MAGDANLGCFYEDTWEAANNPDADGNNQGREHPQPLVMSIATYNDCDHVIDGVLQDSDNISLTSRRLSRVSQL